MFKAFGQKSEPNVSKCLRSPTFFLAEFRETRILSRRNAIHGFSGIKTIETGLFLRWSLADRGFGDSLSFIALKRSAEPLSDIRFTGFVKKEAAIEVFNE